MIENEILQETKRWLRYAHEDLVGAEEMLKSGLIIPRHICWLAQQAAEKTIKAALICLQINFPWRHDLDALRNLLPDNWQLKRQHQDLAILSEWAVEARYPGDWMDATKMDADQAVKQARAIWETAKMDFQKRGIDVESGSK